MVKREEVNILLVRSKGFLETAEQQIRMGYFDLAAFSLEQALQLYLKARLLENGVDFPRTHSIRRLLEMLYDVSHEKVVADLLNEYLMEFGVLEDAYVTSRYFPREFRKDEVERLMDIVRRVMSVV